MKTSIWVTMLIGASLAGAKSLAQEVYAPRIAVTMDDIDVNPDDTPMLNLDRRNSAILDILDGRDLQAAIFVTGMRVDNDQGRKHLAEWNDRGHIIGNHSYSHLYLPKTRTEVFIEDISRGEAVIEAFAEFRRLFRFPYLKAGETIEQRDAVRAFLDQHGYRMGYVTIDASDWAIDARLRSRLAQSPDADLGPYRDFYLEHIWDRAVYYDTLSRDVLGRSVAHTLLLHHNLLAALFLDDLLDMFVARGWKLIDAKAAFADPVFKAMPDTVPAGESILWALAKESGRFESSLRYPGEDAAYEESRMNELGL